MLPEKPTAVERLVCSACDGDWEGHFKTANRRVVEEKTDVHESSYRPTGNEILAAIDFRDCILSLKKRNSGPPGPVGMMGATGERGRPGPAAPPCMCMTRLA